MALPTEVINRMFGLCVTCGADPCKCPNDNAAIRSPSLSSMTLTSHAGAFHSGGPISSGSISGSSISAASIDDLVDRRVDVSSKPEPKPFVPSWEKDEPEEEEEMFAPKKSITVTNNEESLDLTAAVDVIRKTLADAVHRAVMDGNATLANDLMSMTTTELLDHLT